MGVLGIRINMGTLIKKGTSVTLLDRSLDDCYARIQLVLQGPLFRVVNEDAKACGNLCKTFLAELRLGRCPLSGALANTSAMVEKFVEKLPNLVIYRPAADAAPAFGKAALQQLYESMGKWTEAQRLQHGLKSVEPFHLWNWVLTAEQKKTIEAWTKQLHDKSGKQQQQQKIRKSAPGGSGSQAKAAKKAKKKETVAKEVDELFV